MSEFREMRRKRQQLSEEESIGILQKATAGTLALLGDGDYPYAVPISYVYHDGKLYFHSALSGHKVDAIRKCNKASFCVIEQDDVQPKKYTTFFRSVIAFGRIHIIEDEQEKLETARMLGNRYNPDDDESLQKEIESGFSRMLMIRFDIEHLTGKEAIELAKTMTLRDLINSVDSNQYGDSALYQKLRETKPEYGSNRCIQVKLVNGKVTITNVHVGSLGDILTYQIDVAPDLNISKVQLLDAILHELSTEGFSESDESAFWDDFDNLQKAKIVR